MYTNLLLFSINILTVVKSECQIESFKLIHKVKMLDM